MSTSTTKVQTFNPVSHPPSAPSYSHITTVPLSATKRLISFAGQTGTSPLTPSGTPPPLADQVRLALQNVDKCLAASGAKKSDIISNRQYVVEMMNLSKEDFEARERVFLEWWRETEAERLPPPDSLIGVDSLWSRETLYEIEVVCVSDVV